MKYKGKLNLISSHPYIKKVCAHLLLLIRILFIQTYKKTKMTGCFNLPSWIINYGFIKHRDRSR